MKIAASKFLYCAFNNSQFLKKFTQNTSELHFTNPIQPSKNPILHFNDKILQHREPQLLPLSPRATYQLCKPQLMYAPPEILLTSPEKILLKEEQIESCPSTKQTNFSQPTISLDAIDSLQFQSNNPIQDKLSHKKLASIDAQCINIFDGHGGNTLAEYASKKINQFIDSYLLSHLKNCIFQAEDQKTIHSIKKAIQWAYQQIQESFCEILEQQYTKGNKEIIKIGTCAITCVIWKHYLITANCGDSQAVLVYEDQDGLWLFEANKQLNTGNQEQLKRIQQQFKDIDDNVLVKSKMNQKIYVKGILQPTRTLGDYYLKKEKYFQKIHKASKTPFKGPYIKHTPEFNEFKITSNFRYLIVASDGLWDFATKKQILQVVQTYHSLSHQFSGLITERQLNKARIEKISSQQTKKLTEYLRDHVLQKCGKRKNKTKQQLIQILPGERRDFCDDISIITVSFKEDLFE